MPAKNLNNPDCPQCNHKSTRKNGKTTAGLQRYRCPSCGHSFTPGSNGKPGPEPLPKGQKKTAAEIQAAYRERHGLTGNEARGNKSAEKDQKTS